MNQKLMEELVNLDKTLMQEIIDDYDSNRRRNGLIRELAEGATIITNRNDKNELIGYIEFLPKENGIIYVPSLLSTMRFFSRAWINKIHVYLTLHNTSTLSSSVHINNNKSIALHKKLGFKTVETRNNKLVFEVKTNDLLNRIEALIR